VKVFTVLHHNFPAIYATEAEAEFYRNHYDITAPVVPVRVWGSSPYEELIHCVNEVLKEAERNGDETDQILDLRDAYLRVEPLVRME
jgi:hypothetical protein